MLAVYGLGCIPQAYIFSLGPRAALNSMIYIIVNIIFGETTVIAKIFYGNALDYALNFLSFSPQFNMGYALVKIKKTFLYNSECNIFHSKNLCSSKTLHKCCPKCGVLQACFMKKNYLASGSGLRMEIVAMFTIAILFMTLLLIWEYRYVQRFFSLIMSKWMFPKEEQIEAVTHGVAQERMDVMSKKREIKSNNPRTKIRKDTFGEYLLACDVSRVRSGVFYVIRHLSFGIGRGEVLAISGQYYRGRQKLCELYSRQISLSCKHKTLPHWMTVTEGLKLIAVLRGVPKEYIKPEITNYINALGLARNAHTIIQYLDSNERSRLNFVSAVIGAPPVVIFDECTAYQKYSVQRAMYSIIHDLRKSGHAILICSSRYSAAGYTVVVHLKDDVDIKKLFAKYFEVFHVNDVTEVLANVQVQDPDLNWQKIFERMENLQKNNSSVYSYVVTATPIDYVYNSLIANEGGHQNSTQQKSIFERLFSRSNPRKSPSEQTLTKLLPLETKYSITKLKELPWS
ncbi:unnamed protein product, partial [Leptidea sinapis]